MSFILSFQYLNHVKVLARRLPVKLSQRASPLFRYLHGGIIKKKLIHILVPLKNRNGKIEGVVGGEIDPQRRTSTKSSVCSADKNAYMELVDSQGFVIASSDAKRVFKDQSEGHSPFLAKLISAKQPVITNCHRCMKRAYPL